MTRKAFMVLLLFLFFFFHFSIKQTRVMSDAEEDGNKPVCTDFFIRIIFIRIARRKDAEN